MIQKIQIKPRIEQTIQMLVQTVNELVDVANSLPQTESPQGEISKEEAAKLHAEGKGVYLPQEKVCNCKIGPFDYFHVCPQEKLDESKLFSLSVWHKDGISQNGLKVYEGGELKKTDGKWEMISISNT